MSHVTGRVVLLLLLLKGPVIPTLQHNGLRPPRDTGPGSIPSPCRANTLYMSKLITASSRGGLCNCITCCLQGPRPGP